jgi:hypothetical protein
MKKHGHASNENTTRIYRIWSGMLQRCTNPRSHHFRSYGGRGIKVCDRWREFPNFFQDVGLPPKGMSLDRINK